MLGPARLALAIAVVWAPAARAPAQSCAPPDLLRTIPVDGADSVPTDASIRALYAITAGWMDELPIVERDGVGPVAITATFDVAERSLIVTPVGVWEPSSDYTVTWPGLQSTATEEVGRAAVTRFGTGVGPDLGPPRVDGIEDLRYFVDKPHDACSDSAPERYFFDMRARGLSDDSGIDALVVTVFQTAGPEMAVDAAPEPVYSGPAGDDPRVTLPRRRVLGQSCFALVARDGTGYSSPASPEACITTRRPPFWEGCAVVAPARRGDVGWLLALALLRRGRRSAGPRRTSGR